MAPHPTPSPRHCRWTRRLAPLLLVPCLLAWSPPAQAGFIDTVRRLFTNDSGEGARGNTRGGAIRDEFCGAEGPSTAALAGEEQTDASRQLVALAPAAGQKTVQAEPEIVLYLPFAQAPEAPAGEGSGDRPGTAALPQEPHSKRIDIGDIDSLTSTPTAARQELLFEFELTDGDTHQSLEKRLYALPETAGLVKVQLPADLALAVGKPYTWNFRLICRRFQPQSLESTAEPVAVDTEEQVVFGDIQRIGLTPSLKLALESSAPGDRYQVYLDNGLWFDMVAALAAQPDSEAWRSLLQAFDLPDVDPVAAPLEPVAPVP